MFFIIVFTFQRPILPVDAYWHSMDFLGLNNSNLRITGDVSHLEWDVDQIHPIAFSVFWRSLGSNVSRLYNITILCKFVVTDSQEENVSTIKGPYELTRRFQKAEATFVFFLTKSSFGLRDGETKNGSLQYKLNFNEDIPGDDTVQSTGWHYAFDIQVRAPAQASNHENQIDPILIGISTIALGALSWAILATYLNIRRPKPRRRKKLPAGWMKKCHICDKLNDLDAMFCKRCGSQF